MFGAFLEENTDTLDKNYFNAIVDISAIFPKGKSGYMNLESWFGDDQVRDTVVKTEF